MRILLVEDDAMLADAIARAFTQSAHAVDLATNGENADRALLTTEYDVVLLDINLPGIDGLEVLRRVLPVLRARGYRVVSLTELAALREYIGSVTSLPSSPISH